MVAVKHILLIWFKVDLIIRLFQCIPRLLHGGKQPVIIILNINGHTNYRSIRLTVKAYEKRHHCQGSGTRVSSGFSSQKKLNMLVWSNCRVNTMYELQQYTLRRKGMNILYCIWLIILFIHYYVEHSHALIHPPGPRFPGYHVRPSTHLR